MQRRRSCRRFWWSLGMNEKEQIVPIRSLIEGCWPGEWGTDPSGDDGNCVVFRATDIDSDGHLNFEGGASRHVLPTKLKAKSLKRGDIILEASGGAPDKPVGRVALVDQHPRQPSLTSNFFRFMRPVESIDARFLSFQLVALNKSSAIWRYQQQTTGLINLKVDDYLDHKVWCPSKVHQQKIADILTRINDTIEKTEALIEKYQQIKAGLMHDLFTRGVLPDGKLRPTREQAPELYRETGIGFLPKEWTVEKLENLLAPVAHNMRSGPFGSALLKHELVENGIPFLGIDNVHVERFVPDFKRFVSRRKFEQLAKYKVRPGDVVITIMGTVGRCCVIPSALVEALSSKHLWTMTFDEEKVIPELVCWQLNHAAWAQAWFRRAMQGGIMDAIQSNTLKTLMLPVPSPDEQKLIHGRYDAISRRIGTAVEQLDKLRLEKNGLMHDLLTGKVAVKVDEAQEEHV